VVNPTSHEVNVETAAPARDASTGRTGRTFAIPPRDGRLLVILEG